MERFVRHMQHRLISGVVVLIPAVISFMVLKLVYNLTVGIVTTAVRPLFPGMPTSGLVAISILSLVLLLYLVGIFAANMIGRQVIQFFEKLVARVPLVDSVYSTAKQIVDMFRSQSGVSRRTVVIVPFPHPKTRAMGFKTGEIVLEDGRRMATVFIATTPNPTTGFLQIFPLEHVQELDVDADEAIQFIMSGGILQPRGLAGSIDL
jgi:uncharacterized membrane protein